MVAPPGGPKKVAKYVRCAAFANRAIPVCIRQFTVGQLLFLRLPNKPVAPTVGPQGPAASRLEDLETRYIAARHDLLAATFLLDAIAAKLDQMSLLHPDRMPRESFDECRLRLMWEIQRAKERANGLNALPITLANDEM